MAYHSPFTEAVILLSLLKDNWILVVHITVFELCKVAKTDFFFDVEFLHLF